MAGRVQSNNNKGADGDHHQLVFGCQTREDFLEQCAKLDIFQLKKKKKYTHHIFKPSRDPACSVLTIAEQFHNTLSRLKSYWTDKVANQLFWEMQVLKLRNLARKEHKLEDIVIGNGYDDDLYLIDDRVVVMRPCYKAPSIETWAYVAIHETGHHMLCRSRGIPMAARRVNQVAFYSTPAAQKTKTFHLSLFEVEVLAWHEGIKLAVEAGVHMVDKNIDRVKTNCLLSYATLE
jgi:hypothetical protein